MVLLGISLIKEDGEEMEWRGVYRDNYLGLNDSSGGGANDSTLLKVDSVSLQDSLPALTDSISDSAEVCDKD